MVKLEALSLYIQMVHHDWNLEKVINLTIYIIDQGDRFVRCPKIIHNIFIIIITCHINPCHINPEMSTMDANAFFC